MQDKINTLIDLLKSLKSERQQNFAIKLLSEVVDAMNNQSNHIKELTERKFNIKPGEADTELDKYVSLLIIYGYSQEQIALLNQYTINFILEHRHQLTKKPLYGDIMKIHSFYNLFFFENGKHPADLNELKQFIIDTTES